MNLLKKTVLFLVCLCLTLSGCRTSEQKAERERFADVPKSDGWLATGPQKTIAYFDERYDRKLWMG